MKKITLVSMLFLDFLLLYAQPGSLDLSFKREFDFLLSEDIKWVVIQPDQKILIGGDFNVRYADINYGKIIRLNKNGGIDTSFRILTGFKTVGFNVGVTALLIQSNGKILAGGGFSKFNDEGCEKIIRLHQNGIRDNSFNLMLMATSVFAMRLQSDNKVIVAYNDIQGINKVQRIHSDGSLDSSFMTVETNSSINNIVIQSDDKVLIQGQFTTVNKIKQKGISRINRDGSLDVSFNPYKNLKLDGTITCMASQKDRKILIGGSFKSDSYMQITDAVRLFETGEIDTTFNPGQIFLFENGQFIINHIHTMGNEKTIWGGTFHTEGDKNHNIVRLNKNGSIDTTFNTGEGFNNSVISIYGQGKDKLIVTGRFDSYNSSLTGRIVRLNNNNPTNEESNFNLFPNPTNGILHIRSLQPLKLITITDTVGKEILKVVPWTTDLEIDLTDKAIGLYIVTTFSENETNTQRIVKY